MRKKTILKYLVKVLKGSENVYGRNCEGDSNKGMKKRRGRMREEENSDHASLFIL